MCKKPLKCPPILVLTGFSLLFRATLLSLTLRVTGHVKFSKRKAMIVYKILSTPFIKDLTHEDELGAVVRAHLHIEASLNKILEEITEKPDLLPRLRFEQKIKLAAALGLREDLILPLKILGDIRNKFSHRLDAKLTKEMMKDANEAFAWANENHRVRAQVSSGKKLSRLDEFEKPKDMFMLLAVTIKDYLEFESERILINRKTKK